MKKPKLEPVIIDVIFTEDGTDLYRLCHYYESGISNQPADVCPECSGYFTDEDALDEFIEDHKEEITVVKDYRK